MIQLLLALALQAPPDFAFTRVNVVPMDRERVIYAQTVYIRNGKIAEIQPTHDLKPPQTVPQIDAKNELYLLPGLADMHIHLYYTGDLTSCLANGVTTVRNMGGKPIHLDWRAKTANGELLGPRIVTAGPVLGGASDSDQFTKITTETQGIAEVLAQKKAGYDFIKVYDGLPKAALKAIIQTAHDQNMKVAGHSNDEAGLLGTLKLGLDSFEHAEQYVYDFAGYDVDSTKIGTAVKATKRAGAYVCPTMGVIDNFIQLVENRAELLARPEIKFANPEVREWWPTIQKDSSGPNRLIAHYQKRLVKALNDAGVPLLAGTDTHIVGYVPGFSLLRELDHMQSANLTPFQVLLTTTRNPGIYLKSKIGQVSKGYEADLILVRHSPLESLANLRNREGVMRSGRWYSRSELDKMMEDLLKSYNGK